MGAPQNLFNRDLSWLGFNFRVLQEAANSNVPLFERLKFLAIFSSNLDEFSRVRYPSVVAISKLKPKMQHQAGIELVADLPEKIHAEINRQLKVFGAVLVDQLLPALKENGIVFYYNSPVNTGHLPEIRELFLTRVLSFIQPILLEGNFQKRFIPENNLLYFVVTFKTAGQLAVRNAIVNIPSNRLPRFFVLSPINDEEFVVFIDDIIRLNMSYIFPRAEIIGVNSIKFNRDAELFLDEEFNDHVLNKIEKQLRKREIGAPSRFLFEAAMPRNIQLFLSSAFNLSFEEMFAGGRYHNLSDLSSFPSFNKNLQYPKRPPINISGNYHPGDIFNLLEKQDVLLHLPYHSYNAVLSFFNQAAIDEDVTEIFIAIYRVAADSHIVNALISAAKNGKKVTVFIELKARFDEANNIRWSREMKDAGIKIIYSLPHIKVHSKIALVKKGKDEKTRDYAIISTGNFNEVTARFYTDHLLMTTDPGIISELTQLVNLLRKDNREQGKLSVPFDKILVSQYNMVEKFDELLKGEIEKVKQGRAGIVRLKINNLEEAGMINLLYNASQAGVKILLNIRGICCLMPGITGLSENITVKRLVDRYLEHSRLFIFGADDDAVVYLGSADWMTRNLYHRIEVCVGINDPDIKKQLINYFQIQWADTDKARVITALQQPLENQFYETPLNSQQAIYEYLKNAQ